MKKLHIVFLHHHARAVCNASFVLFCFDGRSREKKRSPPKTVSGDVSVLKIFCYCYSYFVWVITARVIVMVKEMFDSGGCYYLQAGSR